MVDETQTGFIEGRSIFYGILTANEAVRWMKKQKQPGALFKVNFRKAYDSLKWCFIEHMLKQVGFRVRMRK